MVTFEEYNKERAAFFKKHGSFRLHDTGLNAANCYLKTYIFADGEIWCESCGPVYEKAVVEVRGIRTEVTVKFFRVEYWNSTEIGSKFYYEKY